MRAFLPALLVLSVVISTLAVDCTTDQLTKWNTDNKANIDAILTALIGDAAKGTQGQCMTDMTAAGQDAAKMKTVLCTAGQSCNTMLKASLAVSDSFTKLGCTMPAGTGSFDPKTTADVQKQYTSLCGKLK